MKVNGKIKCNRHSLILRGNILLTFVLITTFLFAQQTIVISKQTFPLSIGKEISVLANDKEQYNSSNILFQNNFEKSNKPVSILASPKNNIWVRFIIKNESENPTLYLSINYADISSIKLYEQSSSNKLILLTTTGNAQFFNKREDDNVNYNFNLRLPKNTEKIFYLNIDSDHPYELPIFINNLRTINTTGSNESLIIGFYCGIIISTILYNLFLLFATNDKNYFFYVIYLSVLCFAQVTLAGWSFKYIWPTLPQLNSSLVIGTSCLGGIMGIIFAKFFLNTDYYTPNLNKVLTSLVLCYSLAFILSFTKYSWLSYQMFNYIGIVASAFLFYTSFIIYRKGYTSALFYLIAWSAFLTGFIIYLLKNLNIIPFNNFTHFILYIGSSIEAVLLSFALANKINILRNEKEISQAESLRVSKENEQLNTRTKYNS